ncbi:MAG: hypothetical protein GXP40_12430 [Chloroflexi bacterium]|nr:hypothetical protein [Chloroflexota bacterium]
MPYLIDGHNLIPKIGLSLHSLDDEMQLVAILREFCRLQRKRVDVYFDGAPPGQNGARKFGAVTAYFVRQGRTADDAIRSRLQKLGNAARNWTVVSSDRAVQANARAARAACVSSDAFARQVTQARLANLENPAEESTLSPEEVDEWMKIFGDEIGESG